VNLRNHEKLQIYSHMQGGEVLPDATLCNRYGMGQVFGRLRCKNTPYLHLGTRLWRGQVQKHPLFAPGNTFLAGSGAKTPLFCTWRQVFGRVRCKNTPLLHLGRGVSQSVIPPCYNTGCAEMFAFTEQGVASRSVPYGGPECQCYHYKASSRFG